MPSHVERVTTLRREMSGKFLNHGRVSGPQSRNIINVQLTQKLGQSTNSQNQSVVTQLD